LKSQQIIKHTEVQENVEVAADNQEDEEDEETVHAPPAIRLTFNGQDFVLFSHTEPSTYIAVDQENPVPAPQLKADSKVFNDTMDVLFESMRVKDSLGDFLEEGSELQINFVDLEMVLREVSVLRRKSRTSWYECPC
jgi:hypothetical protein